MEMRENFHLQTADPKAKKGNFFFVINQCKNKLNFNKLIEKMMKIIVNVLQ